MLLLVLNSNSNALSCSINNWHHDDVIMLICFPQYWPFVRREITGPVRRTRSIMGNIGGTLLLQVVEQTAELLVIWDTKSSLQWPWPWHPCRCTATHWKIGRPWISSLGTRYSNELITANWQNGWVPAQWHRQRPQCTIRCGNSASHYSSSMGSLHR